MNKIQLPLPTLILGAGIAASGKTTFLRELVKYIDDAFLLDKDTLNRAFLLRPTINDSSMESYKLSGQALSKNSAYYQENVQLQSYRALLEIAKDNLEAGKHPILDGCYVKELRKGYLQSIVEPFLEKIQHQTKVIFCYAEEEVIKQRMRERNLERDRVKLLSDQSWREFLEEQPILPPELDMINHIKIDTAQPLEERLRIVINYLTQDVNLR